MYRSSAAPTEEAQSSQSFSDSDSELLSSSDEEKGVPLRQRATTSVPPSKAPSNKQDGSTPPTPSSFSWRTVIATFGLLLYFAFIGIAGWLLWDKVQGDMRISIGWLIVSSPVCLWDSGYQIFRPASFYGGDLHWIWKPYQYYAPVDYMYGPQMYEAKDGLPMSIGTMDVVENFMNLAILGLAYCQNLPLVLALGLIVASFTFWKTVLYFIQDIFSGFQSTKQDSPKDYWLIYVLPNIWWIPFPCFMMVTFAIKIVHLLNSVVSVA